MWVYTKYSHIFMNEDRTPRFGQISPGAGRTHGPGQSTRAWKTTSLGQTIWVAALWSSKQSSFSGLYKYVENGICFRKKFRKIHNWKNGKRSLCALGRCMILGRHPGEQAASYFPVTSPWPILSDRTLCWTDPCPALPSTSHDLTQERSFRNNPWELICQ